MTKKIDQIKYGGETTTDIKKIVDKYEIYINGGNYYPSNGTLTGNTANCKSIKIQFADGTVHFLKFQLDPQLFQILSVFFF